MKYLVLTLCCIVPGCGEKPERWSQLQASVQQPPFRLVQHMETFDIQVTYVPPWLAMRKDISENVAANLDATDFYQTQLQKRRQAVQFKLRVTHNQGKLNHRNWSGGLEGGSSNMKGFSQTIHHLMFDLKERIYLTDGHHRIPLAFFHLDRNWGMGNSTQFLLTFPAEFNGSFLADMESFTLVAQNLVPGKGEIRFAFKPNPVALGARTANQIARLLP